VDKNPLAVEMAKLSLWLLTLAKDKPFTFLDHAVRSGDSLVGISNIDQLLRFSFSDNAPVRPIFQQQRKQIENRLNAVKLLRKQIEDQPSNTPQDIERKVAMLKHVEEQTRRLTYAADLLLAESWQPMNLAERETALNSTLVEVEYKFKDLPVEQLDAEATKRLRTVALLKEPQRTPGECRFHWPLEFPEVLLDRGGFDALVCNPPFMGGQKITGNLGTAYRDYLVEHLAGGKRGRADLCAYFFLRAGRLLREAGQFGFLATNTIAQGDTREVGLDQLLASGCTIPRAVPSRPWPGTAALEVAHVWIRRGSWIGPFILDEKPVSGITPYLATPGEVIGSPLRLIANADKCFIGTYVLGMGFTMEPEQAKSLLNLNPLNAHVLFPYLNGEDINSRPDQSPSRWVINFCDWPLNREQAPTDYTGPVATDYPECLAIVEKKVKPERECLKDNSDGKRRKENWWKYGRYTQSLFDAVAGMKEVLVLCRVTKYLTPVIVPNGWVYSIETAVFSIEAHRGFPLFQSSFFDPWVRMYSSTLETRLRFSPSDCLETFPMPTVWVGLDHTGDMYHEHRRQIMFARQEGLTKTYNRFHNPDEPDADIQRLRELHIEIDRIVAAAYGWTDLDLGHDFHKTKQGIRFTISEAARHEVLARLLKLNHERHAEEVKQGLHDKTAKANKSASRRGRRDSKGLTQRSFIDDADKDEPAETHDGHAASDERPPVIDEIDVSDIMAAFRQATRGRGSMERDELLKQVSLLLGYKRLTAKTDEALRGHLRAAIRRRIVEADGDIVRGATSQMADYSREDLRDAFCSVMRKGSTYEREDIIYAVARHLGFARVAETVREPIKSAINSAIRQGLLSYEGSVIWRNT
jgi:hypothetical protein